MTSVCVSEPGVSLFNHPNLSYSESIPDCYFADTEALRVAQGFLQVDASNTASVAESEPRILVIVDGPGFGYVPDTMSSG